jgi:hypothetical protein
MVPMPVARLHRIGFLAILATGVGMLGASVWGMAGVDADLSAAVRPDAPRGTLVADHHGLGDCTGRERPADFSELHHQV